MNPQELPYIEPVYGKHAAPLSRERDRLDAVEYVTNGYRMLPGFGTHRKADAVIAWAA